MANHSIHRTACKEAAFDPDIEKAGERSGRSLMNQILHSEKNYVWRDLFGVSLGAFLSIFLLFCSIYPTHHIIEKIFSPYGIAGQKILLERNFVRFFFGVLGMTGLFLCYAYMTRPRSLRKLCSNFYHIMLLKFILFVFPLVFIIFIVVLKYCDPSLYFRLMIREDSLGEWLTFLTYLIACIVSSQISFVFYTRRSFLFCCMYIILSIGFFFIAMEEISWGQRIFDVSTPDLLKKYNYQKEINIHNIKGFPLGTAYIVVGLYGAFSKLAIPKKVKKKYRSLLNFWVPNYYLFFYFFIVAALYVYYDYLSPESAGLKTTGLFLLPFGKDQEPAELLLSFGFLLFLTINRARQSGVLTRTQ